MPIVLETGKKLGKKLTQITINFVSDENCLWHKDCSFITRNKLVINIYPDNDICFYINSGSFSFDESPKPIPLRFDFSTEQIMSLSYANTLIDIYNGDKTFSPSIDEILLSWNFIDQVEEWLEGERGSLLEIY